MKYEEEKANDLAYALGILSPDKKAMIKKEIELIIKEVRHKCAENVLTVPEVHIDSKGQRVIIQDTAHNIVMNTSMD